MPVPSELLESVPDVTVISEDRDQLGESPVWDDRGGQLLRVDIASGTVITCNPTSGATTRFDAGGEVSSVVMREGDGLLLAVGHEIVALDSKGRREIIASVEDEKPDNRFNDCRCDPHGRLWAGTMNKHRAPRTAALYRMAPGGALRPVIRESTLSNGIGWSPAGDRMYFVDSTTQRIDVFDFDPTSAQTSGRRPFAHIEPSDGLPDGLAVDATGGVWLCLFGGGAIRRYTQTGVLDAVIDLPVTNPTCPTFGGHDLSTLYITSARHRLSAAQLASEPLAGAVLALEPGVSGLLANRFQG